MAADLQSHARRTEANVAFDTVGGMGVLTNPRCGEHATSQESALDLGRSPTHHTDCKTHRYRKQKVEHDRSLSSWDSERFLPAHPTCTPRTGAPHLDVTARAGGHSGSGRFRTMASMSWPHTPLTQRVATW